jgi:hypothetical protein
MLTHSEHCTNSHGENIDFSIFMILLLSYSKKGPSIEQAGLYELEWI